MIQLIRGFKDILPKDLALWQFIEKKAISLFSAFGYSEIRLPLLEKSALFARGIGEGTDIVEKEMYSFEDRNEEWITLRPEATAGMVRAYIQHKMYAQGDVKKLFTIGPMFRRERPQKGRYRQFYQISVETLGSDSPLLDAQMIYMPMRLLTELGVKEVSVHVNSLGCKACRPAFTEKLKAFIRQEATELCSDCLRRTDVNPLRVLDCKVPACREAMNGAPNILQSVCDECRTHFQTVLDLLEQENIPFVIDPNLVRGLDYYTRTAFEIQTHLLGAQSAIAGGGRYDGLVSALGGPDTPAIGFAFGLDRLVEVVAQYQPVSPEVPDIFIAALGVKSQQKAFDWMCELVQNGFRAEMDVDSRSLKSQMKQADRSNARFVLLVGEQELAQKEATLRNMNNKEQIQIPFENLVQTLSTYIN